MKRFFLLAVFAVLASCGDDGNTAATTNPQDERLYGSWVTYAAWPQSYEIIKILLTFSDKDIVFDAVDTTSRRAEHNVEKFTDWSVQGDTILVKNTGTDFHPFMWVYEITEMGNFIISERVGERCWHCGNEYIKQ